MQHYTRGAQLLEPYLQDLIMSCMSCTFAEHILCRPAHPDMQGHLLSDGGLVQPVSQGLQNDENHARVLQDA